MLTMIADICMVLGLTMMVLILPVAIWQLIIAVRGIAPMKQPDQKEERVYRFAVLICARNEEKVIGGVVDSLKAQKYPQGCFSVFVIADNCDDYTADEASRHGAEVYERFNKLEVGKGYALRWAIDKLNGDHAGEFDAVCVFDADNLATPDFLMHMNAAFCAGADVAQGYRDTKNPHSSWVSNCYAVYWMMLSRFYHRARYNWGLNCMVSGTGFAFKLSALGSEGWNTHTLVEDCEFSIQQACKGHRIVPVYDAVFYDEQPSSFTVSLRQRHRWVVGTVQCCRHYLAKVFRSSNAKAIDMASFMLSIPVMGLMVPAGLFSALAILLRRDGLPRLLLWMPAGMLLGMLAMSAVALATVLLEKRPARCYGVAIFLYPIFLLPMSLLCAAAVLRPRAEWKPIVHGDTRGIAEVAGIEPEPPRKNSSSERSSVKRLAIVARFVRK